MGGNTCPLLPPIRVEKIHNQLGAEKSGSEKMPSLTEICRL